MSQTDNGTKVDLASFHCESPASWKESWQTDPPGGALSGLWEGLIASFRSKTPLGSTLPDFVAETLDGGNVSLSSLRAGKSALLVFGSLSCPPCVSNIGATTPSLKSLYAEYSGAIEFVYVYTREAHPGPNLRPLTTMDQKRANARRLRENEAVPFPILLDDLEGSIQQGLTDPRFNNPVYLINRAGVVTYKSAWLDSSELPQVLDDQRFWDARSTQDATIKKTYSERIRPLREPYDANANLKFKEVMRSIGLPETGIGPVPGLGAVKL